MNKKEYGLIGLLLGAVLVAVLAAVVLKQYTARITPPRSASVRTQSTGQSSAPAQNAGQSPAPASGAEQTPCNGRKVGNMCIPTRLQSSSLDAFEKINQ